MAQIVSHRAFEPGTTGWSLEDLDDPDIQWLWSEGRFEIVDGVLTKMAPQGFEGVEPLENLRRVVERQLETSGLGGGFFREVDLLLRPRRVARPDLLFLTASQLRRQKKLQALRKPGRGNYHPIYLKPYLVVESVSVSHEDHDRVTKMDWYADAGIPNYWILTGFERSLICYVLEDDQYIRQSAGTNNQIVQTSAFGGVSIPLTKVWDDP